MRATGRGTSRALRRRPLNCERHARRPGGQGLLTSDYGPHIAKHWNCQAVAKSVLPQFAMCITRVLWSAVFVQWP